MSADVDIDAWLDGQGYGLPDARSAARQVLEAKGLTRQGKSRMSVEKLPAVEALLRSSFALHCHTPECVTWAQSSGRAPLRCPLKTSCEHCGGSDNARAARELIAACAVASVKHLLIIGGSPSTREELERLLGHAVTLRLVDGTVRRTIEHAKADLHWADIVLLWGASELHHKVSMQYSNSPQQRARVLHVTKRGIAQLLSAAVDSLQRK